MSQIRTPVRQKAKEISKTLRQENPDYNYLREIFRHLRKELNVDVVRQPKKLPYVPTEEEIRKYYDIVWKSRNMSHVILIKTLLYTGIRVSELVNVKISDIDFDLCQIRIIRGVGKKDRVVLFPNAFKEILAMYSNTAKEKGSTYLFESLQKKPYTDRGIRKILATYAALAGMEHPISQRKLRHFLLTWLKKQGIEDALIQPYSGHESMQSLGRYSKLSTKDAQAEYNNVIGKFPI